MSRFSAAALALLMSVSATGLAVALTTPATAKEKKSDAKAPAGKLTKEAQKFLAETDKAMKAADFATAKTNLMAADALPTKNSYDSWLISQFFFDLANKTKDDAMRKDSFERMATSEFLPKEYAAGTLNTRTVFQSLYAIEFNSKNYPKAIEWGEKYLSANTSDAPFMSELTKVALLSKNLPKAEELVQRSIAATTATGGKPSEFEYTALAEIYQKQKSPKFNDAMRQLVKNYPKPEHWKVVLQNFMVRTKMTDKTGLDLYRLMYATGAASSQAEVLDYAFTAFDAGQASEAQRIIETAMANGTVGKGSPDAKDTLARAKTAQANDDPLPKQEARAAASKTGDLDVFVGNTYLGGGNYAKAMDLLKRGIGKGVRDKAGATIKLGIAQLMSGDAASAKATFASVTGDAKLTELAGLWQLYAESK